MDNFTMNELPFEDLYAIGLTKEKLAKLDNSNLQKLLTGQRTDILRFDFYSNGNRYIADGKLLLQRNQDNTVNAYVVPVRKGIQNDYALSSKEQLKLYAGDLISKKIDGQRYLLQLDRETNEVIKAKMADINLPFHLVEQERYKLFSGKYIDVETERGQLRIKLDLLNEKKFAYQGEQQSLHYVGSYFTMTDLGKEQVVKYNLNEENIQLLLDGYRSNLIELKDGAKGKLQLQRNEDNTASIQVFPVKNEINNDLHLSSQQIDELKRGNLVAAEIGGKQYLCQLDKDTNDILRMQKDNLIPQNIRGYNLQEKQKQDLIKGHSIRVFNPKTNENVEVWIDLKNKRGIGISDDSNILRALYTGQQNNMLETLKQSGGLKKVIHRNNLDTNNLSNSARAAFEERQRFYFDYHNPGITSFIKTDENRNEFLQLFQQQNQKLSVGVKR